MQLFTKPLTVIDNLLIILLLHQHGNFTSKIFSFNHLSQRNLSLSPFHHFSFALLSSSSSFFFQRQKPKAYKHKCINHLEAIPFPESNLILLMNFPFFDFYFTLSCLAFFRLFFFSLSLSVWLLCPFLLDDKYTSLSK